MHSGRKNNEMELNGKAINSSDIQSYHIRWHHAPSIYFERDKDKDDLVQRNYPKSIFGFTGKGMTLATQFLISMDLRQLRIGTGVGIRCSFFKEMVGQWISNNELDNCKNQSSNPLHYIPERSYYFTWTPLIRLGYKLIDSQKYTLLIDGTWAPCIYNFFALEKRYHCTYERNFDFGGTWEKQTTCYINWNLRVAYGFFLNNEVVEAYAPLNPYHLLSVSHYIDGIMVQVGISIRIPRLSKCPVAGCCAKVYHMHNGKQYRGDSIFNGL